MEPLPETEPQARHSTPEQRRLKRWSVQDPIGKLHGLRLSAQRIQLGHLAKGLARPIPSEQRAKVCQTPHGNAKGQRLELNTGSLSLHSGLVQCPIFAAGVRKALQAQTLRETWRPLQACSRSELKTRSTM